MKFHEFYELPESRHSPHCDTQLKRAHFAHSLRGDNSKTSQQLKLVTIALPLETYEHLKEITDSLQLSDVRAGIRTAMILFKRMVVEAYDNDTKFVLTSPDGSESEDITPPTLRHLSEGHHFYPATGDNRIEVDAGINKACFDMIVFLQDRADVVNRQDLICQAIETCYCCVKRLALEWEIRSVLKDGSDGSFQLFEKD